MVLRKAAVALLLLRIIANRRSWNAAAIARGSARVRELLLKYPLLASLCAGAEKSAALLLQRMETQVDRAAGSLKRKLQDDRIANARCVQIFVHVLKKIIAFLFQTMVKVDSVLKTVAPFARYRIVCNVLRRE